MIVLSGLVLDVHKLQACSLMLVLEFHYPEIGQIPFRKVS